jgi:tetratricopeptide (TPR) repeat protein
MSLRFRYRNPGEAAGHAQRAAMLLRDRAPALAAVVDLQVHWFHLQAHEVELADKVLDGAAAILSGRPDSSNRAYISYLRGRRSRFLGEYQVSLEHFEEAFRLYRTDANHRHGGPNRNIIRALLNKAKAMRLLADAGGGPKDDLLRKAAELLAEANEWAAKMSSGVLDERARVKVESGYVALASRNRRFADRCVTELCHECRELDDNVVWARIHLLDFHCRYRRLTGAGMDGRVDSSGIADLLNCARSAIDSAEKTDHQRIIARAHIAFGLGAMLGDDSIAAEKAVDAAEALLSPHDRDYVLDELTTLRTLLKDTRDRKAILFQYSLADFTGKRFSEIADKMKTVVIQRTSHFYGSLREIHVQTGITEGIIDAALSDSEKRRLNRPTDSEKTQSDRPTGKKKS